MPFSQNIESARAETIGAHGVAKAALDDALKRCAEALGWVRKQHADGSLPLLRLPARTDDLDDIGKAAARLRAGATDVVVLGTGGSSLGGQRLAPISGFAGCGGEAFLPRPPMPFVQKPDPCHLPRRLS